MFKSHLPLVFFTLLGQCAVGLAWFCGPIDTAGKSAFWKLISPFLLMLMALTVSALHLRYPKNAWRSFRNLARSPLSQEAFFAAAYTAFTTGEFLLVLIADRFFDFSEPFFWLRSSLGFVLIFSMSRLYLLRTTPAWRQLSTPISFLSTALLLGSLTAQLLPLPCAPKRLPVFFATGFVLRLVSLALHKDRTAIGGSIQHSRYTPSRWLLGAASPLGPALALALLAAGSAWGFERQSAAISLLLVSCSEFTSRLLFYKSHGRDRSLFPPVTAADSSCIHLVIPDRENKAAS